MVPDVSRAKSSALADLETALDLQRGGSDDKALAFLSRPAVQQGPLAAYAQYLKGLTELRLGRPADARGTFQILQARALVGYLVEGAPLREAEADEALGDSAAALAIYERLASRKSTSPDDLLLRVGRTAKAAGETEKAQTAFSRLYYEFPLSDLASSAAAELDHGEPIIAGSARFTMELARAEQLFAGKRYPQAREAFEILRRAAERDEQELVMLRLAECEYFLKHSRIARDLLRPYIDRGSRQPEALYYYALSARDLRDERTYLTSIHRIVDDFPEQRWAEDALNNLASHYIVADEDEEADQTLRELYDKYPTGRHADRAAWKIGWHAYKAGQYAEAARVFERAALDFPRSDYRPGWLYWSARSLEALDEKSLADGRYTLVVLDYRNSYYGRLALKELGGRTPERALVRDRFDDGPVPVGPDEDGRPDAKLPPTRSVIRDLLALGLYDQALDELRYAQKMWGDSPSIQATLAWVYRQQGRGESGTRQFNLYRASISAMRRAYPQFMAAGGEKLPDDLLRIIFPIGYWDEIRRNAAERGLDPYLLAALVAQESTFVPDIRSGANAVGLMQLVPATARQYARKMKVRYSSRLLTDPQANLQIGTAYFADKVREFGDLHLALASYNAGERAVYRWASERPGVAREEFIDDIPYPETQNYVRKILGTAEDYRRLYNSVAVVAAADEVQPARATKAVNSKAQRKRPSRK
jgi:soluble lytic murein transglycosylase